MVAFNPYDPRAAFLLGMGESMLQSGGWSTMPVGLGQALGAGLQGGRRSMLDAIRMKRAQEADKIEEGLQKARKAKLERETREAAALEELIAGLPEEEQVLARADPSAFVKARASGGGLFEGTGLTAQAYNIYRNTASKLRRGEPISDQEWADYQIAYGEITKPEVRLVDGQEVTIRRNIPQLTREGTAPLVPVTATPEGATPETEQIGGSTVTRKRVEPKEWTKDQADAAGFTHRMINTGAALDQFFAEGVEFPAITETLRQMNVPGTNYVLNPRERQMITAATEFTRAALRRESGAVIGAEEIADTLRTYFPVPGDDPQTIEFKNTLRDDLVESTRAASQGAYDALFGSGGDEAGGSGSGGSGSGSPETIQAGPGAEGARRPRTLEEAQKYPSGTKFVWQGKIYTRN